MTERFEVLVAEDDADMRTLVADSLRKDGYAVKELTSGAELLIWIAMTKRSDGVSNLPALIVSDVRMPSMSGLQMLRVIREAHWPTSVILMTAFGDSATRQQAEALDAVLLDKPLQLATLREHARRLLAAGRPGVDPAS